jgi:hypothetical protein
MEDESGEINQSKNHNGKKKKRYISTVMHHCMTIIATLLP